MNMLEFDKQYNQLDVYKNFMHDLSEALYSKCFYLFIFNLNNQMNLIDENIIIIL